MLVPFMLPEVCIAVAIAWPVDSHGRPQVCNEVLIIGAITLWRQICGGVITVLWPGARLARAMTTLVVWPQAMQGKL